TTRGDPVAPADDESGVFAERVACEDILPARTRNHRAEFSQRDRAEQSIESTENPNAEKESRMWQLRRDAARRAKDSGADRVADDDRDAKANAKHAQEVAATFLSQ